MSRLLKYRKKIDIRGFQMGSIPKGTLIGDKATNDHTEFGIVSADPRFTECSDGDVHKALNHMVGLYQFLKELSRAKKRGDKPKWKKEMLKDIAIQEVCLGYVNLHGLPFDKEEFKVHHMSLENFIKFCIHVGETFDMAADGRVDDIFHQQYKLLNMFDSHFVLRPILEPNKVLEMEFRAETLRDALIGEIWERASQLGRYKVCPTCKEQFEIKTRSDQVFCSNACKQKDYRNKK